MRFKTNGVTINMNSASCHQEHTDSCGDEKACNSKRTRHSLNKLLYPPLMEVRIISNEPITVQWNLDYRSELNGIQKIKNNLMHYVKSNRTF